MNHAELVSLVQLRARVRSIRRRLERELTALEDERGVHAAIRRANVHQVQAELELAIAELQAHPDWRA